MLELCSRSQPAHIARHRQHHIDRPPQSAPAHRGAQCLQERDRSSIVDVGPRQPGVARSHGIISCDGLRWRPK
ncbi:Uncharacterised protein [Mycobacterium tuberculosis]|uniref:Uncharacterized protein n=1 Tax=Mycobacterium tuberculosis TaxID=1773 RepID=A0A0U0SAV8_MYCTX|nr:Uncharacterised protein [Mycobacterium tuberculosis]